MAESIGNIFGPIAAETGDTSEFTGTFVETGNTFSALAGAKAHGVYGFRALFGGTENYCYGYKQFTAVNDGYYRVYFIIDPSIDTLSANYLVLLGIVDQSYGGIAYVRLILDNSGNVQLERLYYLYNGPITAYITLSGAYLTKDIWHYMEIRYLSHASAGGVECWLDGVSIGSDFTRATNNYQADEVRIGNNGGVIPINTNYIYFDDLKGHDSYIGAYVEASSIIPVFNYHYKKRRVA